MELTVFAYLDFDIEDVKAHHSTSPVQEGHQHFAGRNSLIQCSQHQYIASAGRNINILQDGTL
jgi:hypothetical protein